MKLLRLKDVNKIIIDNKNKESVVTIGNFDGMHLGHKQLLYETKKIGLKQKLLTIVVFFEPQPKEFFANALHPQRILPFRDKIVFLKSIGIDIVVCLKFNYEMSQMSPYDFVKNILLKNLGMKFIVIGDDFRFGRNKEGDYHFLVKLGKKFNFNFKFINSFCINKKRVSSSNIRKLIHLGQFKFVNNILGHNYSINGRVRYGNSIGQRIGAPTINMLIPPNIVLSGVYIVRVYINQKTYFGVSNIGSRPTIFDRRKYLETHILEFSGNLYQNHVTIEPLFFIRDIKKFNTLDCLKQQIILDKKVANAWIVKNKKNVKLQKYTKLT